MRMDISEGEDFGEDIFVKRRKSRIGNELFWVKHGLHLLFPSHFSTMNDQRSEPLSIENLLQKQREEKEAASKVSNIS